MSEHAQVLYVLYVVLIEIRATKNTKKSQILADVVHNVPMMLRSSRNEEEVVNEIMSKAKRQGAEEYFSQLFDLAKTK